MDIETVRQICDSLYVGVSGYEISATARKKAFSDDRAFTYGEAIPETFYKMLSVVKPKDGEVFYDLGSGLGKPTLMGALFFNFSKCVGVEFLNDLWETSNIVLSRFNKEIKPGLGQSKQGQQIEFVNSDFLQYDFSDADIIFSHATCFSEETLDQLARKIEKLKKGTRIITVTKNLQSALLNPFKIDDFQMNWGKATIYFYEKFI